MNRVLRCTLIIDKDVVAEADVTENVDFEEADNVHFEEDFVIESVEEEDLVHEDAENRTYDSDYMDDC